MYEQKPYKKNINRKDGGGSTQKFKKFRRNRESSFTYAEKEEYKHRIPPIEKDAVRVLIIGGVGEIGKNMYAVEYGDDIIILDCGFTFSAVEYPGVDYILPNISYLVENKDRIRGMIVTHGHLDHIGGIPFVIEQLGYPTIYSRELTLAMIKDRQTEYPKLKQLKTQIVETESKLELGSTTVEFFGITHTIPDSIGIIINTKNGDIVFTVDIKVTNDNGVVDKREIETFSIFKNRKVLLSLCDSTNIENEGFSLSEKVVSETVNKIIKETTGRLIIASFSSQITRNSSFILAAIEYGKKIVLEGRSMIKNLTIAIELGLLKIPKDAIISIDKASELDKNKYVIFATGSQGEEYAVLNRLANKSHRKIKLVKGDTIVFSSSVIPGNERPIQNLKNNLSKLGANLITYETNEGVHATGHGNREDLKWIHSQVKPKFFVPVHGYHYMLVQHKKLLMDTLNMPEQNVAVTSEGDIVEVSPNGNSISILKEKMDHRLTVMEGNKIDLLSERVIEDRFALLKSGFIVVQMLVSKRTMKLKKSPDIITRGFIYIKESFELMSGIRATVKKSAEEEMAETKSINIDNIKRKVYKDLGLFILSETGKNPVMIFNVIITY